MTFGRAYRLDEEWDTEVYEDDDDFVENPDPYDTKEEM